MQKIIVQVDWTTKIILVLIAVLLAGLLAKPYVATEQAGAYREQKVIVANRFDSPVPVEVMGGEISAYITGGTVDEVDEVNEVNELEGGRVKAYVDFPSVMKVVDWKDWEDYGEWLRERYKKK